MKKWKAQVFVDSRVGTIPVEVCAATQTGATELIRQIYNPQTIYSIQCLGESNSSSANSGSSSDGDSYGSLILVGLFILAWIVFNWLPWITMILGGMAGGKIGQIVAGPGPRKTSDKLVLLFLLGGIIGGGSGFYVGDKIQKHYMNNDPTPEVIKNNAKSN